MRYRGRQATQSPEGASRCKGTPCDSRSEISAVENTTVANEREADCGTDGQMVHGQYFSAIKRENQTKG